MTALTQTLDARRAHLRQAVKASSDESLAELRQALAGYRVLQTLAALRALAAGIAGHTDLAHEAAAEAHTADAHATEHEQELQG